jgi:hypothetical protein
MKGEIINNKKNVDEQHKSVENFMQQNKMISNTVCGEIEKFEGIIKSQDRQLNNLDVNITVIMNEMSNILERINDNEKH